MKRKILNFVTLICCLCLSALSVGMVNILVAQGEETVVTHENIEENFEGIQNQKYNQDSGPSEIGNWKVYFANEKGVAEILDDPTNANMGKVLRLNNAPIGTYIHLAYNKQNFTARNFTVSFDTYMEEGSQTSWVGVYSRLKEPGKNMESISSVYMLAQKGQGRSSDEVILSSGGTRPANSDDEFYQFQPKYSFAMGALGTMSDEFTDKSKDYGRFYNTDGGSLKKVWLSFKYELRGNYFYSYAKNKDADKWQFLGYSYLADEEKKILSGTIALGVCGGNYLFDNIKLVNEDKYSVMATSVSPNEGGRAYTYQETTGDNTDVNLIMELNEGYVYDKWYKDADCLNPVEPIRIQIQKFVLNELYSVYEWKDYLDYDLDLTTFDDLDKVSPEADDDTTIKEYYSGKDYRLVVTVKGNKDSNNFYGKIEKRKYNNIISIPNQDGNVTVTKNGEVLSISEPIRCSAGEVLHLQASPLEGKVFAGWYKIIKGEYEDAKIRLSENTQIDYTTEIGGTNIIASFVDEGTQQFVLTINAIMRSDENESGGNKVENFGNVISQSGKYYYGEEISLFAQANKGFSFYYWEINGEKQDAGEIYNIVIDSDLIVNAVFEIEKYRVNIDDGFGGIYVKVVDANSIVKLVAPIAPNGYVFSRWIVSGVISSIDPDVERSAVFTASEKNIYAKAEYLVKVYSVKASVGDSKYGTIQGKGQYQAGDKVTIKVNPKDGYTVAKYIVRGAELTLDKEGNCSFIMPANDVVIKVQFSNIDKIDTKKEIIMYVVFGAFIVAMSACILFIKRKKDND